MQPRKMSYVCIVWIKAVKRMSLPKDPHLCLEHFTSDCFEDRLRLSVGELRVTLHRGKAEYLKEGRILLNDRLLVLLYHHDVMPTCCHGVYGITDF